jgi:hypothetical protein
LIADRRLYLTADKTRLVEEGSVEAAFLYCSPGQMVDEHDLCRLLGAKVKPEAKGILEAPENKALEAPPAVKRGPGRPKGWKPKPKVEPNG